MLGGSSLTQAVDAAVQKGVPQVMVQRAELSVSAADSILSKAPSPNTWTTSIDLMGTVRKTSEFSAAVHNMRRDQYGKVLVKVDVRFFCSAASQNMGFTLNF